MQFLEIVGLRIRRKRKLKSIKIYKRELQKIWNARAKIIPSIVSSLGAIPNQLGNRLEDWYDSKNKASSKDNFIGNS